MKVFLQTTAFFRKTLIVILLILAGIDFSFAQIICNPEVLNDVKHMLQKQKLLAANRENELFDVFNQKLDPDELQCLQYLYAYMPLSDLADYGGPFFIEQIRSSLQARAEMQWGKEIPEEIFLHFVLPLRVNNENLDRFRQVMYPELKKRVAGLSMHDAAIEINHWCHEKVTYRGSDERTSSPLASVKTSFGRCGEESTLSVTALRTVGIPARQVYTPRWAHSDDNHAWVEVWVDGKWHFMGACEPEADLDMGWFAEPARRAMLVHTRAYGKYFGNEPAIDREECFAELNLIGNYAENKSVTVKVLDQSLNAVNDAIVEYQLYNYAEFYPIAVQKTDFQGFNSIRTGLGDLLIWAHTGDSWGYKKISVEKIDTVEIVISNKHQDNFSEIFDLIPPVEKTPIKMPASMQMQALNLSRLHYEDSVRRGYMATFMDSLAASKFCQEQNLDFNRLKPLLLKSYGNWPEITSFLKNNLPSQREWAVRMIESVSDKDLRDTRADILNDHINNSLGKGCQLETSDPAFFADNIMSGRIDNEMMLPWRKFLQQQFPDTFQIAVNHDINILKNWIQEHILIDETANKHSRAPLSPQGVFELRVSDTRSRDIFFVATCRSFGIAARINPATRTPQYFSNNKWINVAFDTANAEITDKGRIHFYCKAQNEDPKYAVNFTVAHYKNGVYRTLDFEYGTKISEFDSAIEVPSGKYMLVTGNRRPEGSVLASVTFFTVASSGVTPVEVKVRNDFKPVEPWAKIRAGAFSFAAFGSAKPISLANAVARNGALLIWIDPDKEPSKHVMADLPAVSKLLEQWGGSILFLFASNKTSPSFSPADFSGLPAQSVYAFDKNAKMLRAIAELGKRNARSSLPVIVVCDKKGNLVYYSEGYKIGIGEQIAKAVTPYLKS